MTLTFISKTKVLPFQNVNYEKMVHSPALHDYYDRAKTHARSVIIWNKGRGTQ